MKITCSILNNMEKCVDCHGAYTVEGIVYSLNIVLKWKAETAVQWASVILEELESLGSLAQHRTYVVL